MQYLDKLMVERIQNTQQLTPIKINTDLPSVAMLENPDIANEFFKQQELMSQLSKWLGTQQNPNNTGAANNAPAKKVEEKKVEEKKEAVGYINICLILIYVMRYIKIYLI